MLIYVIVSCLQANGTILDVYNENCIFINVLYFILYFQLFLLGKGKI